MWPTFWLDLSSASSNMIRGFRLCTKRTLSGLVEGIWTQSLFWWCFSHLWSLRDVLVLLDEPRLQARGEAFWERVAVLARDDQVEGRAELGERERSISVHVAQLPDEWKGRTSLRPSKSSAKSCHFSARFVLLFRCYLKRTIFFSICGNNVVSLGETHQRRLNTSLALGLVCNLLLNWFVLFYK